MRRTLLILGGTGDAAALAEAIAADPRLAGALDVVTSLAGRLPPTRALPGRVRIGGFGGAEGLTEFLRAEGIEVVVDATHPFAAAISRHAAVACRAAGVPRLMLVRPPWRPRPGDDWIEVVDAAAAAAALPDVARRTFLTTGPGGVEAFRGVPGVWFLVRVFEPPAAPLPLARHLAVVQRPPFTPDAERALLARHRIDTLVTKNSGGPTEAKLAAARAEDVRVVMIRRPPLPEGEQVETVAAALAWLAART